MCLQDEAFGLWREQWGNLYPESSQSRQVIQHIINNYYLVNLVDNEFPRPTCLFGVLHKMLKMRRESGQGKVAEGANGDA